MAVGVRQTWAEILALPLSGRVTSVAPVACGEDTGGLRAPRCEAGPLRGAVHGAPGPSSPVSAPDSFPIAAGTNCCSPDGLKQRKVIRSQLWGPDG